MEIADYLRIARRRLWVLILIPLLAAAAVVAFVLQSPPKYSATATLTSTAFVGGAANQFTGTKAASEFAAQFIPTATGPAVRAQVARNTRIQGSELAAGLIVTQQGASSNMSLTFTSANRDDVIPGLKTTEQATLNKMFGLQVKLASAELASARTAVITANQRLDRFTGLYGAKDPRTVYQAQLLRIAVRALVSAQGSYQSAQNQLNAALAKDALFIGGVHSVSRKDTIIKIVVPVVGAAIFLSVILITMLEMLRTSRRRATYSPPLQEA